MKIFKLIQWLEKKDINDPRDLAELLNSGTLPNGEQVSEDMKQYYIDFVSSVLYDTLYDLQHIKNIFNE